MKVNIQRFTLSVLVSIGTVNAANFSASAQESAVQTATFQSPNGVTEICKALPHIPGGDYSDKDIEREEKLCKIDFYSNKIALCPKFWSTSAATMIYSNKDTGLAQSQFESQRCPERRKNDKVGKLKISLNVSGTSSVYSQSSLVYYHLSRFFDTALEVPVAVYRTMDKDAHFNRVAIKGTGKSPMIQKAWETMRTAEKSPSTFNAKTEMFTSDLTQVYGALLRDRGEQYGPEVNGLDSGWGDKSSLDFQETAPFLALRSDLPLSQAIEAGLAQARQNPAMDQALGTRVSQLQMAFWMKEISEITLLDFLLSQQDRVGNIDYTWSWYWTENGEVKSEKAETKVSRKDMHKVRVPAKLAAYKPVLVQRTHIGDNDAGVRSGYVNFTKRTQMLEKLRHFNAKTYRALIELNKDLGNAGPVYTYVKSNLGLSQKDMAQFVRNTSDATQILQRSCSSGLLQFDLEPKSLFLGKTSRKQIDCFQP